MSSKAIITLISYPSCVSRSPCYVFSDEKKQTRKRCTKECVKIKVTALVTILVSRCRPPSPSLISFSEKKLSPLRHIVQKNNNKCHVTKFNYCGELYMPTTIVGWRSYNS